MKKFLLLLVGVLFALSAHAADYNTADRDIYIVGSSPLEWGSPSKKYKFTRTGEYTYQCVFENAKFTNSSEFLIIDDTKSDGTSGAGWGGKHGTTDSKNTLKANKEYQLNTTSGDNGNNNVKVGEDIVNPTVVLDIQSWKITFKTTSSAEVTIYFSTSGQSTWSQPYIYLYNGSTTIGSTWPGTKLTKVSGTSTVWSYTISASDYENFATAKLNNGGSNIGNESNAWLKDNVINGHLYSLDNLLRVVDNDVYVGCNTYKYSGDEATGGSYSDEAMTKNDDGTFSITRTFKKSTNFGIRGFYDTVELMWFSSPDTGNQTISALGQEYSIESNGGNNYKFNLEDGTYTLTFNPTAKTIVFMSTASSDTFEYKYSGADTEWSNKEESMTDNHDGTYSITRNFTKGKAFGVREIKNTTSKSWWWGTDSDKNISNVNTTYNAGKQGTDAGGNWTFNMESGEYTLTFNPTAKTIVFTSTATPAVETAYTIYFDAVRSGSDWANPHLTLGGVEVIGVAEGSLIKYVFNAAAGDKIAFSNGSTTLDSELANNKVYYVDNNKIASASKTGYNYPKFTYRVHRQIGGGSNWGDIEMTYYPDGTWRTSAITFEAGGFGIQKLEDGNQYKGPDNNNDEYGWIWCSSSESSDYNMTTIGVKSSGSVKAENGRGHDWAIAAGSDLDNKKQYVLVFDPKDMTIVFINPTAVVATVATEATTIDGANANNLNVSFTVADYYKGAAATNYTLSNGSFSASAKPSEGTVSFKNVPYATNYTLKPDNGSAMPINIKLPTTTFDISAQNSTLVAPAPDSGSTEASLVVYFKATCGWWYNLPQIVCTCGGEPIPGTVVWNSPEVGTEYPYDFAFIANGVVAYEGKNATEDKTFNFVITPVYPFAVEAPAATPAPSMMRAAAANSFQYVYGAAIDNVEPVEITQHGSTVSGVEGVMIEDEEAPVEYFNLQGQRVNGELAPGIYIRRQGTTVTKVRI